MTIMRITSAKVAYHRNGVCGEGFFVVTFRWQDGRQWRNMVATVFHYFDEPGDNTCRVAVLDIDETAAGNIAMAEGNSWRGDHFADDLFRIIKEWNNSRSNMVISA